MNIAYSGKDHGNFTVTIKPSHFKLYKIMALCISVEQNNMYSPPLVCASDCLQGSCGSRSESKLHR